MDPCHHYEPLSSHSFEKNSSTQAGNNRGRPPKKEVATSKIILAISNWVFIRNQTQAPTEMLRPMTPADFDVSIKLSSTVFKNERAEPTNEITPVFFDKNGMTVSYLALQALLQDSTFTGEFMTGVKNRYDEDLKVKAGNKMHNQPPNPITTPQVVSPFHSLRQQQQSNSPLENMARSAALMEMMPPPPPPSPQPRPTSLPLFGPKWQPGQLLRFPDNYTQLHQLHQQLSLLSNRDPSLFKTLPVSGNHNNDANNISDDEEEDVVVAKKKKASSVSLAEADDDNDSDNEEGMEPSQHKEGNKKKAPSASETNQQVANNDTQLLDADDIQPVEIDPKLQGGVTAAPPTAAGSRKRAAKK